MDRIQLSLKTDNENKILPFLKMQINNAKIPMDISIRRSKNIINRETSKLVDEFQILKFQSKLKKHSESKSSQNLKANSIINRFRRIQINNDNISTSDNNLFLKQQIMNLKSAGNNIVKYRQIKNIKLSSGRDKYISLLKKYKYIDEMNQNKSLSESKINNSKILNQKK